MRVLVTGGRDFTDFPMLCRTLTALHMKSKITMIIEGEARGADQFSRRWAFDNKIKCSPFEADWITYGSHAGPIRNARMLAEGKPDLVVAFPGGVGTRDCCTQAVALDIDIITINHEGTATPWAGATKTLKSSPT